MKTEKSRSVIRPRRLWAASFILLLVIPITVAAYVAQGTSVTGLEIASVTSGEKAGNGGSFFVTTSQDGRYVTFESLATNLAPEPPGEKNWSDIYLRDRVAGLTWKVSKSHTGGLTNEASVDPTITADGRYVAYFSYASNIIEEDTNGAEYSRQGLDVFVYDRMNQSNVRVSLDSKGREIDGNSAGGISADGQYILFVSNGRVLGKDYNERHPSALYLRNWHSGSVKRVSIAMDGGFPSAEPLYATISQDNRYIVYASEANNLAPNDQNGEMDVFLYDRQTGITKVISRDGAGNPGNGRSSQPEISLDGRSITFISYASNLVPDDSNGKVDVFVYDMHSGALSLVSKATNGGPANGDSREPSICGNGRFISYTTDATNLFGNDVNGQRDVILYDRLKGTNSVATVNWMGVLGNGKAHRSFLTPDCREVSYASDAANLTPGDANEARDIFIGDIYLPADFSPSYVTGSGSADAGGTISYTFHLNNMGYVSGTAVLASQVPSGTTYLLGSASAGAAYNASENRIEWQGQVNGQGSQAVSYAVVVEPSLTESVVVANESMLTGDGNSYLLTSKTIVNGDQFYLPLVRVE